MNEERKLVSTLLELLDIQCGPQKFSKREGERERERERERENGAAGETKQTVWKRKQIQSDFNLWK